MRNRTKIAIIVMAIVVVIVLVLAVHGAAASYEGVEFEASTNYMDLMISAAISGDYDELEVLNSKRNAKIAATNSTYPPLSIDEFYETFEEVAGFSLRTDYMAIMVQCCINRQDDWGRAAASQRDKKIDAIRSEYPKISYDDLLMLSNMITWEAGSSWLSTEWKMSVGEVLLNRVASPEFPDTLEGCLYQAGQYQNAHTTAFANTYPYEDCVRIAARLCNGERVINEPSVVFQANFPQGGGVYKVLYDSYLGSTYLCYSNNLYLY